MQLDSGEDSPLIVDDEQLVEWFRAACTPQPQWRVGLEHEKFGLWRAGSPQAHRSPTYEGPRGIRRVLELFIERYGWAPIYEGDAIIELRRDGASITLEPGGQLELSGSPHGTVHEICSELQTHMTEAKAIGDLLQLDWVGLGVHPTSLEPDVPWMPKGRYKIMGRYLPTRGRHALDMMKRTCTIQASFDYADEADCAEKMRLAMGLSPIVVAIFANSPVSAGEHRGYLCERAAYWQEMDPDRCGIFPEVFEEGWGFHSHVARILDTPMFFIKRDGVLIDYGGRSFREFLAHGLDGHRATMADFELQMSTLFPEARLKRVIEVRGADTGGPHMLCALPALWKGILYDAQARREAWQLCAAWTQEDRVRLWADVAHLATEARVRGTRLLDLAQQLLRISQAGLVRQNCISRRGNDETFYLVKMEQWLFQEERSPAAALLEQWRGPWAGSVERLIEATRY